jgi:hypothetical protein
MSYIPKGQARLEVHVPVHVKRWLRKRAAAGHTSVCMLVSAILGRRMQQAAPAAFERGKS